MSQTLELSNPEEPSLYEKVVVSETIKIFQWI